MEIVVLHSDIARLVLGYLKSQQLERAATLYCKTSPHLRQEFSAYQKGFVPHSFFPKLEEIICEYVKISRKVDQVMVVLPKELRSSLQTSKLSQKVSELLDFAVEALCDGKATKRRSASIPRRSASVHNSEGSRSRRRKRKNDSVMYSSDERRRSAEHKSKRPCVAEPFYRLGGKHLSLMKQTATFTSSNASTSDSDESVAEVEIQPSEEECSDNSGHTVNDEVDVDISAIAKPTKESTPQNKSIKASYTAAPPSLPELSRAILENSEFQMKLVENINQALHQNTIPTVDKKVDGEAFAVAATEIPDATTITANESTDATNSNDLLDRMIKNILDATEKDPAFDAIINEIVGRPLPTSTSLVSAGVQCNMEQRKSLPQAETAKEVPRTPLIIRSSLTGNDPQSINNQSFSQLLDPNFSISKLIVFNANESMQKQQSGVSSDQLIGNMTADNFIQQITASNEPSTSTALTVNGGNALEDQIYYDASSGQLTFPVFITNDGLFPLLLNNEMLAQSGEQVGNTEATTTEPAVIAQPEMDKITQQTEEAAKEIRDGSETAPPNLEPLERATPISSGIVNVKAFRSLSTPRRRTTHVRTLTFSPRSMTSTSLANATPISTRRDFLANRLPQRAFSAIAAESAANSAIEPPPASLSEQPIINEVEVLSKRTEDLDVCAPDSNSNSNNSSILPPLLVGDDCSSNQTIIQGGEHKDTPVRSQSRQLALKSCKRQLSKSPPLEEQSESQVNQTEITKGQEQQQDQEREKNQENLLEVGTKTSPDVEMMNEWVRLRQSSTRDLDARLRELNVQMGVATSATKPKRKPRRRKPADIKRKEIKTAEMAAKRAEYHASVIEEIELGDQGAVAEDGTPISPHKIIHIGFKVVESNVSKKRSKNKEVARSAQKSNSNKKAGDKSSEISKELESSPELGIATNIASLLETPFKVPSPTLLGLPTTPGACDPLDINTPLKSPTMAEGETAQHSTSYLFGSLTKSELNETPLLSAITPGFKFTPAVGAKEATPRSGCNTEYSSGGGSSYYRPDECDELDRNFEKIQRESTQFEQQQLEKETQQTTSVCVEIPVEKLRVEPTVLTRVKSFGAEAVDSAEAAAKISPHYTLVSGLPEISAEEECSTSSSASSSSTTSSSSSSSSDGSSSTSSSSGSSSTTNSTAGNETVAPLKELLQAADVEEEPPAAKVLLADQLSDISSTEDEEWKKLTSLERQQDSKLVDTDGEVRYPVRSWLTPSKDQAMLLGQPTLKVILPLKSNEKQQQDLESKRERLKQKLKQDTLQLKSRAPAHNLTHAAASATREIHARFDKPKSKAPVRATSPQLQAPPQEMLKALHLSAKKQSLVENIDDNAMSAVFANAKTSVAPTLQCKLEMGTFLKKTQPTLPKKCQTVDARPKPVRGKAKSTKLVCTPLGFKRGGAVAVESTTSICSKSKLTQNVRTMPTSKQRVSPRIAKGEYRRISALSTSIFS